MTTTTASNTIATIAEKAQKALLKQAQDNKKLMEEITASAASLDTLIEAVQIKENALKNLEDQTKTQVREAAIELDLAVRENEQDVLTSLLQRYRYAAITQEAVQALQNRVSAAESVNAEAIAKAADEKSRSIYATAAAQLAALKAEHAVDTANISADLKAAHMQISFLQRQVIDLQAQVEADRTARVEIAKAESGRQGVVVNTNGK